MLAWLRRSAETLHTQRDYLTQLDSAIGDADHGTNMDRGFQAVLAKLPDVGDAESARFSRPSAPPVSTVGGASGPLDGTAFLRAGVALAGKQELTAADAVTGL